MTFIDVFKSKQEMIPMAAAGSLVISAILLFSFFCKQNMNSYILVITCKDRNAEEKAFLKLQPLVMRYLVKNQRVSGEGTEVIAEIWLKNADTGIIHDIHAVEGVRTVMLMNSNGEFMSGWHNHEQR